MFYFTLDAQHLTSWLQTTKIWRKKKSRNMSHNTSAKTKILYFCFKDNGFIWVPGSPNANIFISSGSAPHSKQRLGNENSSDNTQTLFLAKQGWWGAVVGSAVKTYWESGEWILGRFSAPSLASDWPDSCFQKRGHGQHTQIPWIELLFRESCTIHITFVENVRVSGQNYRMSLIWSYNFYFLWKHR